MPQKLFEIRYNDTLVGGVGYDNLRGACQALKYAPEGSKVVQVNGEGKVIKIFSSEDCKNTLRPARI